MKNLLYNTPQKNQKFLNSASFAPYFYEKMFMRKASGRSIVPDRQKQAKNASTICKNACKKKPTHRVVY
jgi:hypothetical protein